jgi:hypothetical protein
MFKFFITFGEQSLITDSSSSFISGLCWKTIRHFLFDSENKFLISSGRVGMYN